jgi:hypothetical protein
MRSINGEGKLLLSRIEVKVYLILLELDGSSEPVGHSRICFTLEFPLFLPVYFFCISFELLLLWINLIKEKYLGVFCWLMCAVKWKDDGIDGSPYYCTTHTAHSFHSIIIIITIMIMDHFLVYICSSIPK